MSLKARRLLVLAGTSWAFGGASRHLEEFCHLKVSDDTIRRVCDEQGTQVSRWLLEDQAPAKAILSAKGNHEFYTDGVTINTVDGWREMRASVWARRPACRAAKPHEWQTRVLEMPTARWAICAIAPCRKVGASWRRMGRQLGHGWQDPLSVVADGAKWIWDQAARRLSHQASWCVDIYHVCQHLHACAGKLFGAATPKAAAWAKSWRDRLLKESGPRVIRALEALRTATIDPAPRQAFDALLAYLKDNQDSLWYRQRLAEGLPIGSGLIEGACKNMIGKRLKANNARWRIRRAEHMGALRCLDYAGLWQTYWNPKTHYLPTL